MSKLYDFTQGTEPNIFDIELTSRANYHMAHIYTTEQPENGDAIRVKGGDGKCEEEYKVLSWNRVFNWIDPIEKANVKVHKYYVSLQLVTVVCI